MRNESAHIEKLKKALLQKRNLQSVDELGNYDFEVLSEDISNVSGISISTSTLKRLFGKRKTQNEVYAPQIQTKNAIAIYLGFINWEHYVANKAPKNWLKRSIKLVMLIIVIAISVWGVYKAVSLSLDELPDYKFSFETDTLVAPASPYFTFSTPRNRNDFTIGFGDNRTLNLGNKPNRFSHFYASSGMYKVKLFYKFELVDSVLLHVKSNGWELMALKPESVFKPLLNQSMEFTDSIFHIPPLRIFNEGYDTNEVYYTEFRRFKDFNQDADNFNLSIDFKNPQNEGGRDCAGTIVRLFGEGGQMDICYQRKGCSYWVDIRLSEKLISGRHQKMEAFTIDLSQWHHMDMEVRNQNVRIELDGELIFEDTYKKAMGKLKGVVLASAGSASFKNLVITH